MVEQFAPGDDYRLLVVGDRVVAAARREPAKVVGDGQHSIEELVRKVNEDPRRGDDHATALSKIHLDAVALQVLAEQGFTPYCIPPAECRVLIRRNANLSTGGTATDVTDLVHPAVAARAIEAARVIGLDIAGVDVVAQDIGRPLEDQWGVIVEVNAAPGLRMHLEPSAGKPRPVGEAIIDTLFAEGESGRIPIVAVTGVNGKTTTTRFIGHILRGTGRRVGMTCTEGIIVENRRIQTGDCSGPQSAQAVLLNPSVDAAVLETARGGILRAGLGFDRCDVAVVTNIGEGDHLGLADIDTLEKLARVKRTIVEALGPTGVAVLNAHDPLVADMAAYSRGSVVYFSLNPNHPVVGMHRPKGRPGGDRPRWHDSALRARTGIAAGDARPRAADARRPRRLPSRKHAGLRRRRLGPGADARCDSLRPGNVHRRHGARARPIQSARYSRRDGGRRLRPQSVVARGPDRRPRSVPARAAHGRLHLRRRPPRLRHGSPRRIARRRVRPRSFSTKTITSAAAAKAKSWACSAPGLAGSEHTPDIQEVRGAVTAIETALRTVRPGELLMIQADTIDETVAFLQHYLATHADGREIDLREALAVGRPVAAEAAAESAAVVLAVQSID